MSIGWKAFLDGFSQSGLFGWSRMPGGAEVICEETADIEESQFRDLFKPFLTAAKEKPDPLETQAKARPIHLHPAQSGPLLLLCELVSQEYYARTLHKDTGNLKHCRAISLSRFEQRLLERAITTGEEVAIVFDKAGKPCVRLLSLEDDSLEQYRDANAAVPREESAQSHGE